MLNQRHRCPDWDFMMIRPGDPEMECCTCRQHEGANMTKLEAKKMMTILEDCFPLDLDAQRILVRRLNSDFPEFTWDKIQQMPMIIMVGERS